MARKRKNWVVPEGTTPTPFDLRILEIQAKGHLVPTRQLIKTPEQIEGIRRAGEINTAISALEGRVGKNESDIAGNKQDIAGIKQDIADNIKPKLNELSQEISSLKTEIQNINKYLGILNDNLNNLITGLIYQANYVDMVKAKVGSAPGSISGLTLISQDNKTVYFPYKDAAGVQTLTVGSWNVEEIIGLF